MDRTEIVPYLLCMLSATPVLFSIARTAHSKMGYVPKGYIGVFLRWFACLSIAWFVTAISRLLLAIMRVSAQ